MLYLSQFLVLLSQLFLVDPVALDLCPCALVIKVVHGAVDFRSEVVVFLKELKLSGGVSMERSGRWERGGLERFDILMGVPVNHTINKRVFAILEFDIFRGLHLAAGELDVKGDVVRTFIQRVPFRDLRSWAIIFPSSPLVNIRPVVGWSSGTICSWWKCSSGVAA